MKICSRCKVAKPLIEFAKDIHSKDRYTCACKQCRNKHYNEYYANNPDKQKIKNDSQKSNRKKFYKSEKGINSSRNSHLKRTYGITLEDYNKKLKDQSGLCAICGGNDTYDKHGVLAVDHCHKTSKIRGLLCFKCNTVLGSVNDDIKILENAIKYLKNYEI